jgi:putative flippase GtrA
VVAFGRYLVSAGAATLVDVGLVQLLLAFSLVDSPAAYAAVIAAGAGLGMLVNFFVSRRYVFAADSRAAHRQLLSFVLVALSTLALRLVMAFALVWAFALPVFGWLSLIPIDAAPERLAHLGAVAVVTLYSFFAHKHVSFAGGVGAFVSSKAAARP